jgi:TatD DNase family protein
MKIDIHRHAPDAGTADLVVRNLFHNRAAEIEAGKLYSIGLHPWHASAETLEDDVKPIREASTHPQVIAIGEAGLDKSIRTPLDIQRSAFEQQMRIAKEAEKPMIIHCVRAYNEIVEYRIKSKDTTPWIIHWFNAGTEMAKQLTGKGFYLSFGHMLFNDRSKAFQAFTRIPEEMIFLETDDAGYSIDEVYKQAAFLRGISLVELEDRIMLNFSQCFNLQP